MTTTMAYNLISRWSGTLGVCAIVAIIRPAHADPRAVVELFTSQGCSSCPPADKIIGELAKDPSVIAMSMPIDYWDYLGWKDTLADARFSARQKAYSQVRGDREVYTPQAVVNGEVHVIGSDRGRHRGCHRRHQEDRWRDVGTGNDDAVRQRDQRFGRCPPARGRRRCAAKSGSARSRNRCRSRSGGGENGGHEVTYHNVVRNLLKVGDWNGTAGSWTVPLENISRDGVDGAVVYVQDGSRDKPGAMLGAAITSLH